MGVKLCDKCGYRHGRGRCCIDIYQQLGRAKGPSVVGKVLLAFVAPLFVFIGSLILAGYFLSIFVTYKGANSFSAFLIALIVTLVFVQLIRICTRKPIDVKSKMNEST